MTKMLTTAAQIMCPHGGIGSVQLLVGNSHYVIGGVPVLCEDNTGTVTFACPAQTPCTAVVGWIPNQEIVKIKGKRVLSERSLPITNNGPGSVKSPGQETMNILT